MPETSPPPKWTPPETPKPESQDESSFGMFLHLSPLLGYAIPIPAANIVCPLVLWLNENAAWGGTDNFIESDTFAKNADNVLGVILLQGRTSDTFGDDIRRMNKERLTLREIMASDKFNMLERSRLNTVVKDVFSKLDKVEW